MAIFRFAKSIIEGKLIKLFNHGQIRRDFTCIDDVTRVIVRPIDRYRLYAADFNRRPCRRLCRVASRPHWFGGEGLRP